MAIAIALVLLVIGTVAFHVLNPWWFTPIASNWSEMDDTVNLTFWVCGAVFVAVNLFMAYAIVRYRHRKGQERRAEYEPEYKKLEWWLIGLTSVGVIAMLAPGLAVWAKFVTVPEDAKSRRGARPAMVMDLPAARPRQRARCDRCVADQRRQSFRHGRQRSARAGRRAHLGQELHLPLDQPVKVLLRSKDVLHDFTVPQFRVKMDLVPGMITYLWLTPTKVGSYEILCEELCGLGHFVMRGRVVVDDADTYDKWLATQPTFAQINARPAADAVAGQGAFAVCSACHGAAGEGNQALNAPKLAGQSRWYLERQLRNFKHGFRGGAPGDAIASQMAAIAAPLDDATIANVAAYIETLPDNSAQTTITGDAKPRCVELHDLRLLPRASRRKAHGQPTLRAFPA